MVGPSRDTEVTHTHTQSVRVSVRSVKSHLVCCFYVPEDLNHQQQLYKSLQSPVSGGAMFLAQKVAFFFSLTVTTSENLLLSYDMAEIH